MAPLVDGWDYGSWSAVYNALSFGPAPRGSRAFFLLNSSRLSFSLRHFSISSRSRFCFAHPYSESSVLTSHFPAHRYRGYGECDDLLLVPLPALSFLLARTGLTRKVCAGSGVKLQERLRANPFFWEPCSRVERRRGTGGRPFAELIHCSGVEMVGAKSDC